jgi:lipoprotein-anchoring transpeptidase ErfK/SrfK
MRDRFSTLASLAAGLTTFACPVSAYQYQGGGPASEPAQTQPAQSQPEPSDATELAARPQASAPPREFVRYDGPHPPGTIVVSTPERRLYYVLPGNQAIRYGVGVGRPGFTWTGIRTVAMKRKWPSWQPPPQMLRRRPDLPRFMQGGPANPLGARAMYLAGTLYRIHGSNEPNTIGQAVSSGCIRMTNDDVVDLYERVKVGARVVVE